MSDKPAENNNPDENSAEKDGQESQQPQSSASFLTKIRNLFRFKISITKNTDDKKPDSSPSSDLTLEDSEGSQIQKASTRTVPKKKAEKPKTAPKPKAAPKAKAKAKPKSDDSSQEAQPAKKKLPLLLFIIIGVVVIGGVVATLLIVRANNTPEKRFEKAQAQYQEMAYDKALESYGKLITDNLLVSDSYLGVADVLVAQENIPDAIIKLEAGFEQTGDQRIADKLLELRPPPAPDSGEPQKPLDVVVTFSDPAFEKMIRLALKLPDTSEIKTSDLSSIQTLKILGSTHAVINETLNSYSYGDVYTVNSVKYTERGEIKSLADISYFSSLTALTIGYNHIEDISGIEKLTKLEVLGLYSNDITDISKLSQLPTLKLLYLYYNKITSLEPLKALPNLRQLLIQHNEISDLSPIKDLPELGELFVASNKITDISPISSLPKLRFFYADHNQIADVTAVESISTLTDVSFLDNPVKDMSPTKNIQNVNVNKPFGYKPS